MITSNLVRNILFVASLGLAPFAQGESIMLPHLGNMDKYHASGYSSVWGYTAPDGREYALLGVESGMSVVDITDAPTLTEIAFVPTAVSSWTELKTYKHFAYVVKDGAAGGIQIVDLSGLPKSVTLVKTVMDYPSNHTLWIDEDRALMFTVGGDNMGVTTWSLANPASPKQIGTMNGSTYVHDMYVKGNRAYLAEIFSKSFSIYDITDPANPKLINRVRDAKAPSVSFHNMWTTDDGRYLVTTEETSGRPARVWDLADEMNPKEVSKYLGPGNMAHNVHIQGRYAHFAHYGGGYRVVDLQDIANPVEVAHFDVNPNHPQGFNGVWGIYPYFKSGKVIMSSMEDGLFVTRFEQ
ncbi:MAG: choice-of-anchor B family protein [Bdellovibrionota bacterium]